MFLMVYYLYMMEYFNDGVLTLMVYFENFASVSIMYKYTPACRSTRWGTCPNREQIRNK